MLDRGRLRPYHPATAKIRINWQFAPDLPYPTGGHQAGIIKGKIILAGGTNWLPGRKQWLSPVYLYDPAVAAWRRVTEMPQPTACAVCGGDGTSLYFCGGFGAASLGYRSCYRLLARPDGTYYWDQLPDLPQPRIYSAGTLLDNALYVIGGAVRPDDIRHVTATTWALPLALPDRAWRTRAPLPGHPRCVFPAVACRGDLFVFGGCYRDDAGQVVNLADAYRYSPRDDRWVRLADLPYAVRAACALAYDDRHILILGGGVATTAQTERYGPTYGFQDKVLVYDVVANTYSYSTPMPLKVAVGQVLQLGKRIYYLGGEDMMRHRSNRMMVGTVTVQP